MLNFVSKCLKLHLKVIKFSKPEEEKIPHDVYMTACLASALPKPERS
jgi:hypothetical protein